MKIKISGPAAAFDKTENIIKDNAVLKTINNWVDTTECAELLSSPLDEIGITGGTSSLIYTPSAKYGLLVVTEYSTSRKLKKTELKELINQTKDQWSDGIGVNCFADYYKKSGIRISIFPMPYNDKDVECVQFEDETSSPTKPSLLLKAASEGDLSKMKELLKSGQNIESIGKFEQTPLMITISNNHVEAALFLISNGANVNHTTKNKSTAIQLAAMNGQTAVLKALLDAGANINERDDRGATPVMWASNRGHKETVELLINYGADLNAQDTIEKRTALMYASPKYIAILELLLKHGANPTLRSKNNLTAYQDALQQCELEQKSNLKIPGRFELYQKKAAFLKKQSQ